MPATLDHAFQSPFHKYVNPTDTSGSSYDIRQPPPPHQQQPQQQPMQMNSMQDDFQNNYRIKKPVEIESEADEIKSVYDTHMPMSSQRMQQSMSSGSSEPHDCNYLIAKLLSCSHCRNKLKDLLKDDMDTQTQTHDESKPKVSASQSGGGNLGFSWNSLIVNIILGIMLILLIDYVLK